LRGKARTKCWWLLGAWCYCASLLLVPALPSRAWAHDSTDHLQRAAELISQGALDTAEREARLALNDPVTRAVAWATLGTIRLRQKKFDESVKFLEKALRLNPALIGGRLTLGLAFLMQGKKAQAREVFQQTLKIDPNNPDARFSLAQLEAESGNYKASLDAAEPISHTLCNSPSGIYLLTTDYLGLGQSEEARALVARWKGLTAVPPAFSINFGSLLLQHKLVQEAVDVLESAKSVGPVSFELVSSLADSYWVKGDLEKAEENYEHALSFNGNCVVCYMRIAQMAEREGETEKALAYLIKAKRLEPENPDVIFEFGKVCLERNLFKDALPALEKAVQLKPDNDQYTYVLAAAYVGKRRSKEALVLLDRLVRRNPEDPIMNYAMGSVLYTEGTDLDRAEAYLKKSIRLQPVQVAAYYYLGMVELAKGDQNQAAQILRELLQRYPDHIPALEQFGTILLKQGNYAEAQQVLERVLQLDQTSLMGHYQYSLLLARLGKREESAKQMEIAKQLEAERKKKARMEFYLLDPH
jgi:tetratricopeptide (TPR) repeat protein